MRSGLNAGPTSLRTMVTALEKASVPLMETSVAAQHRYRTFREFYPLPK